MKVISDNFVREAMTSKRNAWGDRLYTNKLVTVPTMHLVVFAGTPVFIEGSYGRIPVGIRPDGRTLVINATDADAPAEEIDKIAEKLSWKFHVELQFHVMGHVRTIYYEDGTPEIW